MTRSQWVAALTIVIGVIGSSKSAIAEPADAATITIQVLNQAGLSQKELLHARTETARIFNSAGLNVAWRESANPGPERHFIVNIVPSVPHERLDFSSRRVLGMAPGTNEMRGIQAWAFYAQIQAVAERRAQRLFFSHRMAARSRSS